jgi:hypothetical protein
MNKRRRFKAKRRRYRARLWQQGRIVTPQWVINEALSFLDNMFTAENFSRTWDLDFAEREAMRGFE